MLPSRECGTCTACCRVQPIRTPELRKTSHVLCQHCRETEGCRIYAQRPQVCRDYDCGWRLLAALPEDWRPDLSGIFVDRVRFRDGADNELPAQYSREFMVQLLLLTREAIDDAQLPDVIALFVKANVPVFLGVCGPPGFQNALVFLNEFVKRAVAENRREDVSEAARKAAALAAAHRFVPLPE
jgi:hypothetical protein